jgi:cation transport regulator ChaC
MSARVWYFAYGSNMQPATFAGRRGITPSRTLAARAPGLRLVLDKTPLLPIGESFANLVAAADAETYGVLYEVSEEDLTHVDLTEGVLIGNYSRVEIAVTPLDADAPTRAFTLVSDKHSPELKPSDRYMALLIEGAETHGLPPEWIAMLRAVPTCMSSAEAMVGRRVVDAGLAMARRLRG